MIGRDHLGGGGPAVGHADHDRRRLGGEVERTGDDVAVFGDDHPRRGTVAHQHLSHAVQPADGFDADNRRLRQSRGLFESLLLKRIQLRILQRRGW